MFVKWRHEENCLTAVLLETGEIGEQPVQVLASLKEEDLQTYWGHLNFWKDVSTVLEDFPDETREQILTALAQKVQPIPTWAIEKMENLFEEYHRRGEAILAAIHEEKKRHEAKLTELTLQGRNDNSEFEQKKLELIQEAGLQPPRKLTEKEL